MFKIEQLEAIRTIQQIAHYTSFCSLIKGMLVFTNGSTKAFQVYKDDIMGMDKQYLPDAIRISRHRAEYPFVDNVKILYNGMEGMSHELIKNGWEIVVEKNRYTGSFKIVFRNEDGLMCRLPYNHTSANSYFIIPFLIAVKNYRIKARKIMEFESQLCWEELITKSDISFLITTLAKFGVGVPTKFTKDDVPKLLETIRELEKDDQVKIILDNMKEPDKLEDKIIELAEYLKLRAA